MFLLENTRSLLYY